MTRVGHTKFSTCTYSCTKLLIVNLVLNLVRNLVLRVNTFDCTDFSKSNLVSRQQKAFVGQPTPLVPGLVNLLNLVPL